MKIKFPFRRNRKSPEKTVTDTNTSTRGTSLTGKSGFSYNVAGTFGAGGAGGPVGTGTTTASPEKFTIRILPDLVNVVEYGMVYDGLWSYTGLESYIGPIIDWCRTYTPTAVIDQVECNITFENEADMFWFLLRWS